MDYPSKKFWFTDIKLFYADEKMKVNIVIRIDKEIAEKARELGLNISKTCEKIALKS